MANPALVTPASTPSLAIDSKWAKQQSRIDFADDDEYLAVLIRTATERVEEFTGRRIIEATFDYYLDRFPAYGDFIELPNAPLSSITSLKYTDADGTETTWDSSNYFASSAREPGALILGYGKTWPSVTLKPREAIVIRYVVGYGTTDATTPEWARLAIISTVDFLYHNRGSERLTPGEIRPGQGLSEVAEMYCWPHRLLKP